MNKNIYENELTELQKEFENLNQNQKLINIESNNMDLNNILDSNNKISTGLNVSRDKTSTIQELLNKLNKYIEEKKPTLAILTPCYGGLCYSEYTISLINTIKLLESQGLLVKLFFLNNDSLVSRARNNLIGSAMLDTTITHFIFIDGDIIWNPIDIIKLILSDELVIGGLYPKKAYKFDKLTSEPSVITQWIDKKNQIDPNIPNDTIIRNNLLDYNLNYKSTNLEIKKNIIEVKHLATGFMLFKRQVIENMIDQFPETKYIDDTGFLSQEKSIYTYALFDCGVINESYYSEDWLFCHRWSSIGGKIYADISIDLVHIGTEKYQGSFIRNLLTSK
jgi:hypothetical protein